MSLHKFAEQVASQGRGDDSLLVHMTPEEVRNLQQFAQANGTTLTINPTTGLPEAGLLSDLFKSIAPIALGAFLGPAGFGMSSMMAGVATGGITALATGSLSRGLMAGLGAYGGAGLGDSLMNAGSASLASSAGATAGAEATQQGLSEALRARAIDDAAISQGFNEAVGKTTSSNLMSAGFDAAKANPMAFAKQNLGNLAYAAAPIAAGMMVPTTTKLPDPKDRFIRMMDYNINPDTGKPDPLYGMREMTPIKTSDFKGKTFQGQRDLFRQQNPNPYELGVGSLNQPPQQQQQPTPMASGGITSLAKGGVGTTLAVQQDNASAGQPGLKEWLDKLGLSQEAREIGSPDLYKAVNLYNVGGSSLDPYRQKDTRDWASVMASDNPMEALIQQNLPLYGGAGHIELTDTGGSLVSGAGDNLTSDLSRYEEFGIKLNPTQLKTQLNSIDTSTPMGRAQYNRINNLYEEAVRQAQEYTNSMAGGGIVALANGGFTDQQVKDWFLANPNANDQQISSAMQQFKVGTDQIARATGTVGRENEYNTRFVQAVATPTTDASEFLTATKSVGLQDQNLANALSGSGLSASAQYALTHRLDDAAGLGPTNIAGQPFYDAYGYKAGDAPGDQGGLEGLYANIDYAADRLQDQINAGKLTVQQAQNLSLAEMERLGINQADVRAATGSDFGDLFKAKAAPVTCGAGFKLSADGKSCVPDIKGTVTCGPGTKLSADGKSCVLDVVTPTTFTSVVPGGTQLPGATVYDNGAYGNYGSGPATGVDYKGNTVSIATPGDIITNPDGTRTVVPNIPGRDYGGFTGMDQVKSAYTAGGGSLGYTSPVVKTAAEHEAKYNKLTDDSLDAYNYLMGKGKNLTQRKAETKDRPVMARYDEAVLGRKIGRPVSTTATTKKVIGVPGNPQSYFNEAEYLAANPDVAAELKTGKSVTGEPTRFTSGYEHYLMYGKAGGRAFTGDYEGYTTAAALADAANAANASGGGDAASPGPGPDSTSPANSDPGGDVAKTGGLLPRGYAMGGGLGSLGSYSDGGRLLRGPGDGVSDSIPATIGRKRQPARLADGEFVIPARIVSELGNGSTDAGAKKLYAMMDRVQRARGKTTGKNKVAANSRADKYLPA
jgi:hypothetical protein